MGTQVLVRNTDALRVERRTAGYDGPAHPPASRPRRSDGAEITDRLLRRDAFLYWRSYPRKPRRRGEPALVTVSSRREPALVDETIATRTTLQERFGLTDREAVVADLVAEGMSYHHVARELFISRSTVGFHLGNIYAKVGVSSRHDLHLIRRSLLTPTPELMASR